MGTGMGDRGQRLRTEDRHGIETEMEDRGRSGRHRGWRTGGTEMEDRGQAQGMGTEMEDRGMFVCAWGMEDRAWGHGTWPETGYRGQEVGDRGIMPGGRG